jgi:tetratricopeptide (TPR) repeat protein
MLDIEVEDDRTKNQNSYQGLISTIEIGQRMLVLIIASCTPGAFQDELIDRYETELAPSIPSYRVQLDRSEPSLRQALENLVDRHPELQAPKANAVITVTGAADLLSFKLGDSEEKSALDRFFGYLQWTREGLREFPFPIVLWVSPQILSQLSAKAPDFWSWRGGVFRFVAQAFVGGDHVDSPSRIDSSFKPESTSDLPIEELLEQVAQIEAKNPNSPTLATLFDRLGQAYRDLTSGDRAENRNRAIQYFQQALTIQKKLNLNRLNTLIRLANLYRSLSNWNKAESLYQECLDIETEIGNRAGMASSWGCLGDIARNRGDYDKAEALYHQSLAVYNEIGDRAGMATSWGVLGDIARNRGDYDKAEALYHQSLAVKTDIGDRAGMATSWGQLGDIARNRGDYDKAEALYHQSLEVETEMGDLAGMATSSAQLGDIARNRGNYDQAEELYNKSLKVREDLKDRAGTASSWGLLGYIASQRGDYDQAEELYHQSLAVRTELGDRAGMATSWGVLGDIARNRGDYDKAEALYHQALEVRTEIGDRAGIAAIWGCLGENELEQGNLEAAETWLNKALAVFAELQMPDNLAELNWDLARLYRAKGDEPQAQTHYAISHNLYTKLVAKKELERIESGWSADL